MNNGNFMDYNLFYISESSIGRGTLRAPDIRVTRKKTLPSSGGECARLMRKRWDDGKFRRNWKDLTTFHSTSIASNILRIITDERKLVSLAWFPSSSRRRTVKTQSLRTFEVALVNTFLHAAERKRLTTSRWDFVRQECAEKHANTSKNMKIHVLLFQKLKQA